MGNTGAEIALDLAEQACRWRSVRSPVNVVYRDVLGRPTRRRHFSSGACRLRSVTRSRAGCAT
jgi:hypothetical protein